MAHFSAILFDLDDTLVDSGQGILSALNHSLLKRGMQAVGIKALARHAGIPLRTVYRTLGAKSEAEVQELIALHKEFQKDKLHLVRAYGGTESVLGEFKKRGIKMAIVTGRAGGATKEILEHSGLGKYFTTVVGSEDTKEGKPSPQPFLKAAKRLGVPASECLVVGDGWTDIEGGHAAGMKTARVTYGFGAQHSNGEKADYTLKKLSDVLALIE